MDIIEGRELLAQARPGPWKHDQGEIRDASDDLVLYGGACGDGFASVPDASLIVWARNNLSDLFDAAERFEQLQTALWRLMNDLHDQADGLGSWHDATEYLEWANKEIRLVWLRSKGLDERRRPLDGVA